MNPPTFLNLGISHRHSGFCFSGKCGRVSLRSPHPKVATLGWPWGPDAPFTQCQETLGCPPLTNSPWVSHNEIPSHLPFLSLCITHLPFITVFALLYPCLYWKLKNKTKVTLSSQSRGAALALQVGKPIAPALQIWPLPPLLLSMLSYSWVSLSSPRNKRTYF